MRLSFRQQTEIGKRPTLFPELILCLSPLAVPGVLPGNDVAYFWPAARQLQAQKVIPKIHTLREDINGLWKPGEPIRFVVSGGNVDEKTFATGVCVSTQQVVMRHDGVRVHVWVEGRVLDGANMVEFYQNDGFNSFEEFDTWFAPACIKAHKENQHDKRYKLIHWTNKRY